AGISLNSDVIVVVDPAEVVETKVARQRRCFGGDALHHASIAANGIYVVIKNVEAGPVITAGQPLLCNAHADARGNTLAERTGRGFNARDPMILGMSRCFAVELSEA